MLWNGSTEPSSGLLEVHARTRLSQGNHAQLSILLSGLSASLGPGEPLLMRYKRAA